MAAGVIRARYFRVPVPGFEKHTCMAAQQSFDFDSLSAELKKFCLYPFHTGNMVLEPAAFNGMTYIEAAHLLTTSSIPTQRAVGLWAFARSVGIGSEPVLHNEVVLHDGKLWRWNCENTVQLYVEALHCDASFSFAYVSIGGCLSKHETITLLDGRVLNERQVYLEALRFDPTSSDAYCDLAVCLRSDDETATLHAVTDG